MAGSPAAARGPKSCWVALDARASEDAMPPEEGTIRAVTWVTHHARNWRACAFARLGSDGGSGRT